MEQDCNKLFKSFKVFRHIRTDGHGNITAYCEVFPNLKKMLVGLAFCSPKEPSTALFIKETGRLVSEERFNKTGVEIDYTPNCGSEFIPITSFILDYIDDIIRKEKPMPHRIKHKPKWLKKFYKYFRG